MRIAMIGVKGMPLASGIEHVVEQVGSRLAKRGHEITAFVRPHFTPRSRSEHLGIRLVHLPSVRTKHLDAITHGFLSSLHTLRESYDVVHIHSIGLSVLSWIPRLAGHKVVVQSHGLDWQRAKWGPLAQAFLKTSDRSAVTWPDATIVVSQKLKAYYEARFRRKVHFIANGADECERLAPSAIRRIGLAGDDYALFAARLVPEKGCHVLLDAFEKVSRKPSHGDRRLIIAGDATYQSPYAAELKRRASDRVRFLGFVTGQPFQELMSNAYLYVQPSTIEGMSTALLNAMGYGNCVLVSDIEENLEVVQDVGYTFRCGDAGDLAERLDYLFGRPSAVSSMRARAQAHVRAHYNWDRATDEYEDLYYSLLQPRRTAASTTSRCGSPV